MVSFNNQLRIQEAPRVNRKTRSPQHSWAVKQRPFVITPFLLAPVLPGETLKMGMMQARAVSDPLSASRFSSICGWWLEHYVFYVKHRQMPDSANIQNIVFDPATSLASTSASARDYYDGRGYNWAQQCLEVVVREWFRDEGETINVKLLILKLLVLILFYPLIMALRLLKVLWLLSLLLMFPVLEICSET